MNRISADVDSCCIQKELRNFAVRLCRELADRPYKGGAGEMRNSV